jgi:hypothetical protein
LTVKGAVELHDRPRAVAVCWGHDGWWDVGPSSPAIRERACPATGSNPASGGSLCAWTGTFDEDRRILVAVFCGIDWAEDHHDIALVDQDGTLLAQAADRRRHGRVRRATAVAGRGRR